MSNDHDEIHYELKRRANVRNYFATERLLRQIYQINGTEAREIASDLAGISDLELLKHLHPKGE